MYLPDIKCPHCGRPFANYAFLEAHIKACAAAKQEQLDEAWRERDTAGKEPR